MRIRGSNRILPFMLAGFLIAIIAVRFFGIGGASGDAPLEDPDFNTILTEVVYREDVKEVEILSKSQVLIVHFNEDAKTGEAPESIEAAIPRDYTDEIVTELRDAGVSIRVNAEPPGIFSTFLTVMPFLLLILVGVLVFSIMRGAGGAGIRGFSKGKSSQIDPENLPKVTFADVAGVDEAIESVQDVRDYLDSPEEFNAMGIHPPRGILLYGPPGSGKTLLARAIAGEANVPFFKIAGSDFVELYVGMGAKRVRDLFAVVRKAAPAILFIDEIDAVGRHRGTGIGGGHDEREQTLNQILVELDGFEGDTGIIVIAATNRPDVLDPALLRPGRIDRKVEVGAPDLLGRVEILKVHGRGKPVRMSDDDTRTVALRAYGMTGADLANAVNEALLLAKKDGRSEAIRDDFLEAIDIVQLGPEKKGKVMLSEERLLTAVHEAGHTVVGLVNPQGHPIAKVTIAPRGSAGGFTMPLPEHERNYRRKSDLMDEIAMSMGGRIAEELVFDDPSTGASNDLEKATAMAKKMVKDWAMSGLGYRTYTGSDNEHPFLGRQVAGHRDWSDEVAKMIDEEMKLILNRTAEEARQILAFYGAGTGKGQFQDLVDVLLEEETLHAEQIIEAFGDETRWTRDSDGALVPPAHLVQ